MKDTKVAEDTKETEDTEDTKDTEDTNYTENIEYTKKTQVTKDTENTEVSSSPHKRGKPESFQSKMTETHSGSLVLRLLLCFLLPAILATDILQTGNVTESIGWHK